MPAGYPGTHKSQSDRSRLRRERTCLVYLSRFFRVPILSNLSGSLASAMPSGSKTRVVYGVYIACFVSVFFCFCVGSDEKVEGIVN